MVKITSNFSVNSFSHRPPTCRTLNLYPSDVHRFAPTPTSHRHTSHPHTALVSMSSPPESTGHCSGSGMPTPDRPSIVRLNVVRRPVSSASIYEDPTLPCFLHPGRANIEFSSQRVRRAMTVPQPSTTHIATRMYNPPSFSRRRAVLLAIVAGSGACVASDPGVSVSEVPGAEALPASSKPNSGASPSGIPQSQSSGGLALASASNARARSSASASAFASASSSFAPTPRPASASASASPAPATTPGAWAERPPGVSSRYNYCFYSPASGCPPMKSPKVYEWTYASITSGPVTGRIANKVVCCYEGHQMAIPGRPITVDGPYARRHLVSTLSTDSAWA